MHLELAEGGLNGGYYEKLVPRKRHFKRRTFVRGYHRMTNIVPAHYRHLNDSSLFSFKLADGGYLYICVPDPNGQKAPRYVREDMFDGLPDSEMEKVINYVLNCNDQDKLQAILLRRNQRRAALNDAALLSDGESAITAVTSAFDAETTGNENAVVTDHDPNAGTTSFWDKKIFGIKAKVAIPGAIILYKLFK